MPELPEVETIKLGLQKYLVGHTIENIEVRLPKMVTGNVASVIGAKVVSVERFGKGLVINLSNDYSIAIHIKMTGQLIYRGPNAPKTIHMATTKVGKTLPNNATHVIFYLKSQKPKSKTTTQIAKTRTDSGQAGMTDAVLYYNDIRQFGWIKIVKTSEVHDLPFFKELGPEPFKGLDLKTFSSIVKKKKTAIKVLMMDQKQIGGIGNIYANDALFLARIMPTRPAHSLSDQEIETVFNAILTVMKKGLEVGGASEWQYVNALGEAGGYQNFFLVYGKDGKSCPNGCGGKIKRITLGGRGTFYCEKCQT